MQFDSAIYYVNEEERMLCADVLRFGAMEGECRVDFCTEDAYQIQTYESFQKYAPMFGTLVFKPGEVYKTIQVPIVEDDRWEPLTEFQIRLSNAWNCRLAHYLFVARCKVVDSDYFPTNRLGEALQEEARQSGSESVEDLEESVDLNGNASDIQLMLEYFKLNYEFSGVGWRTRTAITIDQLQNVYFLLTTYLVTYVTDDILGKNGEIGLLVPGSRDLTLVIVGALFVVPYFILYFLDCYKAELKIGEISRSALQENIFSTYLNWGESTRKKVPPSQVTLAVSRDAIEIVETGYMKLFDLAKNVGRLAVSGLFIVSENPDAIWVLVFFAIAMYIFISLRYRETVDLIERASEHEEFIVETVQESLTNYRIIRDYNLMPKIQEVLQTAISEFNEANVLVTLRGIARDYFPSGLSTILLALYIPVGGEAVISGSIQIGVFLATVNLLKDIGSSYSGILSSLLDITKAIEPMTKVTSLMNLRSRSPMLQRSTALRRMATREARRPEKLAELRRQAGMRYGSDAIRIELHDVSYRYQGDSENVVDSVNISLPQGLVVGIVGPRSAGKSTLMKLLGQVLQPTGGEIFVPSYLRILHVSSISNLLKGSIWDNLVVSQSYWRNRRFQVERAIRICRRFGLSAQIMSLLEQTKDAFINRETFAEEVVWRRGLTKTDLQMITLARAFIYDPAVLVLNLPTASLPLPLARSVVDFMREFVNKRGLEMPLSTSEAIAQRRPRTVFASFLRYEELEAVDVVWAMQRGKVFEVHKDEVEALFNSMGTKA